MRKIREFIFRMRLRRAVRTANKEAQLRNRKMLVIDFKGRPKVFEKQRLKALIKQGYFIKGVNIQIIEKMAYYITP